MKKFIFILLFTFTFYNISIAQITITSGNLLTTGQAVFTNDDTLMSITNTPQGTGQTWDYSGLVAHEKDTVYVEDADSSWGAHLFPTANGYVIDTDSNHVFLELNLSHIYVIGFAALESNGDTTGQDMTMPIIAFPSSYGSTVAEDNFRITFQDTARFDPDGPGSHPYVDSIRANLNIRFETEMDAEGVINMPKGDFNALRQHIQEIEIITIEMLTLGNWSTISDTVSSILGQDSITADTSHSVRFWTTDSHVKFALLSFDLDSTGAMSDGEIEWIDETPDPLGIANFEMNNKIFPIPAKDNLFINVRNYTNANYSIYALDGRLLQNGTVIQGNNNIDVSGIAKGTYLLRIFNSEASEATKIIIE